MSNGLGSHENPTDPTWLDMFWAGLRIFGLGFGLFLGSGRYRVDFGSLIYSSLNPIFFFFWQKPYSYKGLSPPPSPTSQVSISQNITAHHYCRPQTTHHSHHPCTVETTLQRRNGTAIYHQRQPMSSFQTKQNPRNKTHSDLHQSTFLWSPLSKSCWKASLTTTGNIVPHQEALLHTFFFCARWVR